MNEVRLNFEAMTWLKIKSLIQRWLKPFTLVGQEGDVQKSN